MSVLLIDANYLCYRAYHAMGRLSHGVDETGVIYGVMRDIQSLRDRFNTDQLVFCFDSKESLRKEIAPTYKANRDNKFRNTLEVKSFNSLKKQMVLLQKEILPELGFENVKQFRGYEGDDLIASACATLSVVTEAVIVSGDTDLFQLLRYINVIMYNPRGGETTDEAKFIRIYGIRPDQWPMVKALAGCKSDNIPGVIGVGEITALRYLKGELPPKHKAHKCIADAQDVIRDSLKLVQLPFPGTPGVTIYKQPAIEEDNWRRVADKYGMKSIRDKFNKAKTLWERSD